jgi:arabinofuranosyltransferase
VKVTGAVAGALVLGLALFVFREHQLAGVAGFPLDDSWIHFRFARNLAEGYGFSYNPGVPVAGSTAPLWTLLLGGLFAMSGSHPLLAKAVGAAASLGAALLGVRLALAWTGDRGAALLAGALAALSAPLLWGALSGMEVSLAALLVTAGLLAHARDRDLAAALLLALAVLARPESVLALPLVWAAGPLTARRTALFAACAVAIVGPWVAFNLATAGSPLPAPAAAKIEGGLAGFLAGAREPLTTTLLTRPWRFSVEWAGWLGSVNALLPLLLLPGFWLLWRRGGRRLALPVALLALQPLAMALLAPYRSPEFQEGRYSIHLVPMAFAVAALPVAALAAARDGAPGLANFRRVLVVGLAVAALVSLWPAATRYGWAVQNIEAMQVRLGRWVAANTPRDARLALNDVGAIGFLSRREVIDVMGLVTPAIIPYRRAGEDGVLRYLERACPDYLIVFPAWFPRLTAMGDRFTAVERVRLARNTVAGAAEMVVYETAWSRGQPAPRACPRREEARRGPGSRGVGPVRVNFRGHDRGGARMRRLTVGTALALLGLGATETSAQTFRWTDEQGRVNYSQGIDSIPERFRPGAQFLTSPPSAPAPAVTAPGTRPIPLARGSAQIRFTPGQPILVNARINDTGSVRLLLDTGASVTAISPRTLAQLGVSSRDALRGSIRGVTGTADALFVLISTIDVNGAKAGPIRVVAHDVDLGQGEGLLGRDYLDRFIVNIDNQLGIVTLTPR